MRTLYAMAKRAGKAANDDGLAIAAAASESTPVVAHPVTMLEQIIGQQGAKQTLERAMKSGRVHHAWIFHGPMGVGKRSAAVAFAAALLDPTTSPDLGGNLAPEPDSEVQKLVKSGGGAHPDLHIITKELASLSREDTVRKGKQFGIAKEVIEEFLIEPAMRSRVMTAGGGDSRAGKVFIVDEAELMGVVQQNSLLKLMEEPPAGTVIILVTSQEERILPTVRSRCQRVSFSPLEEGEMNKWLSRRGGEAGLGAIEPEKRSWLLRFAAGSPGAAEVAIVNDLFAWDDAIKESLKLIEQGKFPIGLGEVLAKLIDERAAAWVKLHPEASKDGANKQWARRMLAFLSEDMRARLRLRMQVGGGKTAEAVEQDVSTARLMNAIDAISAAEGHLALNVNMGLLLDNLAAQMGAEPVGV